MAQDSGQAEYFTAWTADGTRLAVDPVTDTIGHASDGTGVPIVIERLAGGPDLLGRLDGALLRHPEALPNSRVRFFPVRIRNETDGFVSLWFPGQRALTAIPGGSVDIHRATVGGWELFRLEQADPAPALFAGAERGAAAEALCQDPSCDPAAAAVLFSRLDAAGRRRVRPALMARPDYADLFPLLRTVLAGGEERSEWNTRAHLGAGIAAYGWDVGDHSYGWPTIVDGQYGPLRIGRYCSIAGEVRIVVANHATETATTYPFAALSRFWPSADAHAQDHVGKGVSIGNSVWIGAGATLLPGAEIGDGAVIGAMAVVANKVPPYTVVVGNPARVIRQRFDSATTARLIAARWWDLRDDQVDQLIPLLLGSDVQAFLAAVEKQRG